MLCKLSKFYFSSGSFFFNSQVEKCGETMYVHKHNKQVKTETSRQFFFQIVCTKIKILKKNIKILNLENSLYSSATQLYDL